MMTMVEAFSHLLSHPYGLEWSGQGFFISLPGRRDWRIVVQSGRRVRPCSGLTRRSGIGLGRSACSLDPGFVLIALLWCYDRWRSQSDTDVIEIEVSHGWREEVPSTGPPARSVAAGFPRPPRGFRLHLAEALDWTESLGLDCRVPVRTERRYKKFLV